MGITIEEKEVLQIILHKILCKIIYFAELL